MTYTLALFPVGLAIGFLLIGGHLPALLAPSLTTQFLRSFPRNLFIGRTLLVVAVAWSLWLMLTMDLGEFAPLRQILAVAVFFAGVAAWIFLEEFLAVRALSMCLLLAADVLLCAAFLQPPVSRLLLVFLAYGWIFAGLFWVALPWLLRDQILWILQKPWRLRLAAWAGIGYGVLVLACAVLFWRS